MTRAFCALLLGAFFAPTAPAATLDSLETDGWHTWRVEAAESAPAWCCFSRDGQGAPRTCNLDRQSGYGNCNGAALNGFAQVYAKIESGETVELRVLGPGCTVEAEGGVTDHGDVEVDESFHWLSGLVKANSRVSEDALAAIAVHRGDAPIEFLVNTANGAADSEIRKSAMFWLAQTGAAASEEAILQAIAGDPDREVREHAVFTLSLLPEDRAVDALIAVLEDRGLHREVREQALFWLAQSESDRALAVFERLLADGN